MINRIAAVEVSDGEFLARGRPQPVFFVPDPADRGPGWSELREKIGKAIGDHPVASLALGFAFGIAVGCLLKRR